MPTATELDLMRKHILAQNFIIKDAGSYPLITYYGPVDTEGLSVSTASGQYLRAACLAARNGIPTQKWETHVLNLNDDIADFKLLANDSWKKDWNGIWIHQGHGNPGSVLVNGIKNGLKFYSAYARHIVHDSKFKYGLIKTCYGAKTYQSMSNKTPLSFIEVLAKAARQKIRLYSSAGNNWIPLSGPHLGIPMISPNAFFQKCHAEKLDPKTYFTSDHTTLDGIMEDDETYNKLLPYLTDAYFQSAHFDLQTAQPVASRPKLTIGDTRWYHTP